MVLVRKTIWWRQPCQGFKGQQVVQVQFISWAHLKTVAYQSALQKKNHKRPKINKTRKYLLKIKDVFLDKVETLMLFGRLFHRAESFKLYDAEDPQIWWTFLWGTPFLIYVYMVPLWLQSFRVYNVFLCITKI